MSERLSPEEVVAAILAATTDVDALEIERRHVIDTAEEDPGREDDLDHNPEDGQGG